MANGYSSFLIRCWRLSGDERRIAIEHIQSGGRTRVASLAAAVDWISAHWDAAVDSLPPADRPGPAGMPAGAEAPARVEDGGAGRAAGG
jgi:hypothetical protein